AVGEEGAQAVGQVGVLEEQGLTVGDGAGLDLLHVRGDNRVKRVACRGRRLIGIGHGLLLRRQPQRQDYCFKVSSASRRKPWASASLAQGGCFITSRSRASVALAWSFLPTSCWSMARQARSARCKPNPR